MAFVVPPTDYSIIYKHSSRNISLPLEGYAIVFEAIPLNNKSISLFWDLFYTGISSPNKSGAYTACYGAYCAGSVY